MNTPLLNHDRFSDGAAVGKWFRTSEHADRIECVLCPRQCSLKDGDRGFCFVRENRHGQMALSTYGKSTGFCIDPIEKKPLNHFFPGTPVLSFGTAGCNLGCKFCQNWDISKSREVQRLSSYAEPEQIARAAVRSACSSVAFTYNDPIIWAEYAIDTARACHAVDIKTVAVTAGYISPGAREEFFQQMDAANVDLKAFSEAFYHKITYSHLEPVLDTIRFLKRETDVWFELTNLIIPQENDDLGEMRRMCDWIIEALGDDVPIHFTAFHPDFRMLDKPRTDPETLGNAYAIAKSVGLKYAYVGNVHDVSRQSTYCGNCSRLLIERDWYQLGAYNLDPQGRCRFCETSIPGRFGAACGTWGNKRQPIRIEQYAMATAADVPADPPVYSIKDVEVTNANSDSPTASLQSSAAAAVQGPVRLDKLSASTKQSIVQMAASWVVQATTGQPVKTSPDALGDSAQQFVMGVFVTLKRGDLLRGCCGVLGKPMPLGPAITSAATRTAKEDNRFAPISPSELKSLSIDVTLLGPFKKIAAEGSARANEVIVGKHGLMIQRGKQSGLLLPSVATERGWDAQKFLQAVCSKAGLPIAAWESSDADVSTFDGEAMGGMLADYLPSDLRNSVTAPLTADQLTAYSKLAGQNIAAMATGGTPSYVVPQLPDMNVNAIVLSMQWGRGSEGVEVRQGNALQVSLRPGIPLQSTLFQMCQQAAAMFQRDRFAGQLQIGLSIGIDPALHGWGEKADLSGVDGTQRGLVISDAAHCGFAFDPRKSPEELQEVLRRSLPIGSRDAALHSLQIQSTMPHVISVSGPVPVASSGTRPTAVAGKFYPAEDAARRAMVGTLFKGDPPEPLQALAIMVPHAGIKYSGKVAARVWQSVQSQLENKTVLILSPKHTRQGVNWSICPYGKWKVSNNMLFDSDSQLANLLVEKITPFQLDAAAHEHEHGIEVQLPILERLAPKAKIVGAVLNGGSWGDIQAAAQEMADLLRTFDDLPLLVISSDMNHYAPDAENRRRDRLALDAMTTGDPKHLIDVCSEHEISMCGLVPAAFVMETLHRLGLEFDVRELGYATSAEVNSDKSQVVGYAGVAMIAR
ncbi:MAG: AmmeMemoRadiSam system radical SAM enzyme [Planctomycetales bacterium]|nr:AmmeMemoRadiSam system radical SAM enzyme [Planctomycetales bacterium]